MRNPGSLVSNAGIQKFLLVIGLRQSFSGARRNLRHNCRKEAFQLFPHFTFDTLGLVCAIQNSTNLNDV